MQEQREAPPDMQCKDKFLVQGVVLGEVITANDITQEMVLAVSNNLITNFCNCVCVCTCHVLLTVIWMQATRAYAEDIQQEKSSEELVRREVSKQQGGFSFVFLVIIALLGILLGYIVKK
ncbi:hypothetical protein GW17_00002515 [Ensete ventricosum]|nr:hypothetical protein GW17_00002515 [Ensete ventricosum]